MVTDYAERNRAIKKVLEGAYGRGKVSIRTARGVGTGFVNIYITTPDYHLQADTERCYDLLDKAGISHEDKCIIDFGKE